MGLDALADERGMGVPWIARLAPGEACARSRIARLVAAIAQPASSVTADRKWQVMNVVIMLVVACGGNLGFFVLKVTIRPNRTRKKAAT